MKYFMGLVQYLAKFMPDATSVAKPIQELTRKGITLRGGGRTADSFSGAEVSWVGCRTRIVADASPVGLGEVLAQEQGRTWRAVI